MAVYLVTGANSGLGLDATRQLAVRDETKKVYLACRTESKALEAIDHLVEEFRIPVTKLAFVLFNASASKSTIYKNIMDALPQHERLDGLIFNAGGVGCDHKGLPTGPNRVLDMVQINLLGHIHLLDVLKVNGRLKARKTTIVYSGSEAARGVAAMGIDPPKMPNSVNDYTSLIDGSAFKTYEPRHVYAYVKGMAALYWSAFARENPEYYVLTVSPGGTRGTEIASQPGMSKPMQIAFPLLMKVFGVFGNSHPLSVGAKRYVDAVNREGAFHEFESGTFVASVRGTAGHVGDQTKVPHGAVYADIATQDAMYQAIREFA
jgi:NAD(P)-dependent dehydrogenase (short-subunit alcohol dehydrogenase family)